MAEEVIHQDLIDIALERATGTAFERFVHAFYPTLAGVSFVPLGGTGDGGADAMLAATWGETEPDVFYQASVQKDHRAKIRGTVQRLLGFGRKPNTLFYVTSRRVPRVDAEERALSKELNVSIRIQDGAYIGAHVNDTATTRSAFQTHLAPALEFLTRIGKSGLIEPSPHVRSPAVFVFLRQELEKRTGDRTLSNAVLDSLILWALEDTDPDQKKFKSRDEIAQAIATEFPFAKDLVLRGIDLRLAQLSSKNNSTGREIRHHQKEKVYCLPYETRLQVRDEAAADEALRLRVVAILEQRIVDSGESLVGDEPAAAAELALRSLQLLFEREGIEFASFLERGAGSRDYTSVADCVDHALLEEKIEPARLEVFKGALLDAIRGTFYKSTPEERMLLGKLARTYALLFGLQAEPRIVNYFQDMASDFYLYVGTDLLVRALSERYVRPEDQRVRTLLRILAEAGATLVLAEPVLEEVWNHLRTTSNEYDNYFAGQEAHVTFQIVRNCPKILIRAFFYVRLDPPDGVQPPGSWQAYLQQFVDPSSIGKAKGKEELRRYLMATFKMKYEGREQIEALFAADLARKQLETVATALEPSKTNPDLAINDATMALAVYGRREKNGELANSTVFGFRTWWLTGETSILKHTRQIVEARGARYMMRPEFVLNFVAVAPKLADVRASYEAIFPSLLGVRLANRVKDDVYLDMMTKVREASALEPGRVEAVVADLSDRLKSDFRKVYANTLKLNEPTERRAQSQLPKGTQQS